MTTLLNESRWVSVPAEAYEHFEQTVRAAEGSADGTASAAARRFVRSMERAPEAFDNHQYERHAALARQWLYQAVLGRVDAQRAVNVYRAMLQWVHARANIRGAC